MHIISTHISLSPTFAKFGRGRRIYITFHEVSSVQTPNFSWAELNSNLDGPKLTKTTCKKTRKPKLLVKYVIIIYALGLAHERFGVWIKAVPKTKFPAKPGGKNGWAVPNSNSHSRLNWLRRRTFHVLNSRYYVRLMKSSASELGLRLRQYTLKVRTKHNSSIMGTVMETGERTRQNEKFLFKSSLNMSRG